MTQVERSLAERQDYRLRVPKIPRQSVDIFAHDTQHGNYGLSAERISTLLAYAQLQQTLDGFDDLTFSPGFITRLPDDFRAKLDQNLCPGIPLAELEIPTSDKVFLAELLTADALTDSLSQAPIEIWITPPIQKELERLGHPANTGLQQVDYAALPLTIKQLLVGVMEIQEMQIHTILLARERFPDGVPALGFKAIFSRKRGGTTFNELTDLETQYGVAQEALENPLQLLLGKLIEGRKRAQSVHVETDIEPSETIQDQDDSDLRRNPFPLNVVEETKCKWWEWNAMRENGFEDMEAVADYLRPQYERKTIYEIFEADTSEKQQEVLAAFWRREGRRHIDLGDESWIENNLYLKPNGTLELHSNDDLYDDWSQTVVTGDLSHYQRVAMVDQAVKWIRAEMEAMEQVHTQWAESGLRETQSVECTLLVALEQSIDLESKEEIKGLPQWFVEALNQEARYYSRLPIQYTPEPNHDDVLFSIPMQEEEPAYNLLRSYFLRSRERLVNYTRLISSPEDLLRDLGIDASATQDQIKAAYRQIAKETRPIQSSSPNNFDPEEWTAMNDRFIRATKAYKGLSRGKLDTPRITTLGRLTSYFEVTT